MDFDIGKFRALADKNILDKEATLRKNDAAKALMIEQNGEWFVDSVFNAVLDHLNLKHNYSGATTMVAGERTFRDWTALTELVKVRFVALGFDVINLRVAAGLSESRIGIYYEFK